jgi:putative hemolysin
MEGIREYAKRSKSGLIFGCSSIRTMDKANIRNICEYLAVHHYTSSLRTVKPKRKFRIRGLNEKSIHPERLLPSSNDDNIIKGTIPTLIFAYLKAGAKLCAIPALDKRFRCVDFMTILDLNHIKTTASKKTEI